MLGLARHAALPSAAVLLALSGTAEAREATLEERAALVARVGAFEAAMVEGDAALLVDMLPPRILPAAAPPEMPLAEARAEFIEVMAVVLDQMTGTGLDFTFGMAVDAAQYAELSDGTLYATIPTFVVATFGDRTARVDSETLALLEDGEWYLVSINAPESLFMLQSVYPAFSGVRFNGPAYQLIGP